MTRQEAEKISEFLTFLEFFRAVPVFSWNIEEAENYPDGFGLIVHIHNSNYLHAALDLFSGISGFSFFRWSEYPSKDYYINILLY